MSIKDGKPFNFKDFCENSTINGLASFMDTKNRRCKFIWVMANILCLSAACALCYQSVTFYLSYEVRTTLKVLAQDDKPDFPAITFCTTSFMRTSFKHYSTQYYDAYSVLLSSWNPGEVEKVKKFEESSCKDTAVYPNNPYSSIENNFYKFLKESTLTFGDMVLLCWFGGQSIDCTKNDHYFNIALTDLGSCFTFNEIRNRPSQSGIHGPLRLPGIGPKQGFKFLLNVHQEEYCTTYNVYNGIGSLFGLKENYAPYDFNCDKGFFKLPVGYDVSINVKPTKFVRNTEHLNKCTSKQLVDYDGKYPLPYYRGFCLVAELVKVFHQHCHCILPSFDFYAPYMNYHNFNFDGFPKNVTMDENCDNDKKYKMCDTILLQKFWMNKLWNILPSCPLPCFETVYTITFSMKKLSRKSLNLEYSADRVVIERAYQNATAKVNLSIDAWIQQNLVMANFYYGDTTVDVFTDDQAFEFHDLVIYIANVLGLFYGMSFTSFFEIFYAVFRTTFEYIVYKLL